MRPRESVESRQPLTGRQRRFGVRHRPPRVNSGRSVRPGVEARRHVRGRSPGRTAPRFRSEVFTGEHPLSASRISMSHRSRYQGYRDGSKTATARPFSPSRPRRVRRLHEFVRFLFDFNLYAVPNPRSYVDHVISLVLINQRRRKITGVLMLGIYLPTHGHLPVEEGPDVELSTAPEDADVRGDPGRGEVIPASLASRSTRHSTAADVPGTAACRSSRTRLRYMPST